MPTFRFLIGLAAAVVLWFAVIAVLIGVALVLHALANVLLYNFGHWLLRTP